MWGSLSRQVWGLSQEQEPNWLHCRGLTKRPRLRV